MNVLISDRLKKIAFVILVNIGFGIPLHASSVCFDAQIYKAGTPTSPAQAERMLANATFTENQKLSRSEKIRRVRTNIGGVRNPLTDINDQDLAQWIVDIADCTGNDFSIFAGLIRKESTYCLEKLNRSSPKSTASGCGQITIWPVREFQNHLDLPGRRGPSDPEAKGALEKLINSCLENRSEAYKELLSKTPNQVKAYLRNQGDYEFDLFTAALYLKFQYGFTGFYYDPNVRAAGALSRYGEGTKYGFRIDQFARDVRQSSQLCIDDSNYINDIERTSCELSEDSASCSLTTPHWDI